MSKKSELKADLERVGYALAGAHLTRQARAATFSIFAKTMRHLGLGIRTVEQIDGRHLQAFVTRRTASGIGARTLANELSHLRAALVHVGKQGFVASPACSNRALGIGRGSRIGTKSPLRPAALNAFRDCMAELGRPGIGCVHVIAGTKGGRPRDVRPTDVGRALAAIRDAIAVLESTGQRYLVVCADGSTPANLRQADGIYRNLCHRAGIQSHSARYAFAQDQIRSYREQGFSRREACAATSQDLGHGDGRGRYIASVYARDD